MTAKPALTADLRRQVLLLEDDLRDRVAADEQRTRDWKAEHAEAVTKERTAAGWMQWRDDRVTQAAVAWVLGTVFVRFCEDNGLVGQVWVAGPAARRQEALDAQAAYFRSRPEDTDREWLRQGIDHLAGLRATGSLFDRHSALHWVSPSGQAATVLLDFWRARGDDGELVHDLTDPTLSTRFLGDLYQDLSQHAKDTYALLQTPEFVEEFILDRTLTPALAERPLDGFRMIDPTCGSGHFLLGAFDRLLDRWHRHAPGLDLQTRVQSALDAVHGVDLNPFAVAIARFRLTVAALQACGRTSLEDAPAFTLHLAVGDSLIHGPDPGTLPGLGDRTAYMNFTYATEDGPLLLTLLEEGRYDVVVGNPPYITVKDRALNQIYRSRFAEVCKGTYALTVPFMRQFFALAKDKDQAGWVAQITGNSFMKRDFGVNLIDDFLKHKDLNLIVDTSGAYIPNHATPTAIIVGRNRSPVTNQVRALLGVRSEPRLPSAPSSGIVWTAIRESVGATGQDNRWITSALLSRSFFAQHPWSLTGGAAPVVRKRLDEIPGGSMLRRGVVVGGLVTTGEDACYAIGGAAALRRSRLVYARCLTDGEEVSDYSIQSDGYVIFPYSSNFDLLDTGELAEELRFLWPQRSTLLGRRRFGTRVSEIKGFRWFEYRELYGSRLSAASVSVFRKIATHNIAVIDHQGRLFKEACHGIVGSDPQALTGVLGVLTSSTACFWLKEKSHSKGGQSGTGGFMTERWEQFYEFTGTRLQDYPLPTKLPVNCGRLLDQLALNLSTRDPSVVCEKDFPNIHAFAAAEQSSVALRQQLIAQQEELDWEVYGLYRLIEEDLTYGGDDLPGIALGERAFEIVLARAVAAGEEETAWFARHGSTPITEIPTHWPAAYRELVQRRLDLIESDPNIRLLEKPEYKRRWAQESWEKRQERAVREWLLDRLEDRRFWFDAQGRPMPRSVAQLADDVARDDDLVSVLALWEGRPDVPVTQSLARLLADEAVPYLAAYRYKDSGLRKRVEWERTWELQRREDAGEKLGPIAPPPKYTSADFRKNSYWQARGKLDVPKERFILYPDAGRETDPTPLLGWAGWDHAQQSLALSLIIGAREDEGWPDERLVPLVAGLAELQPWVRQWHSEVDETYGVSLADFCAEQLASRSAQVGRSSDDLAAWRPAPPTRGRRANPT